MRTLLNEALGRLSGAKPDGASVIRLETNLGGGKTHNLIALYHASRGSLPAARAGEFMDPGLLPDAPVSKIGVFVGTTAGALANPAAKPTIEPISKLLTEARQREDWTVIYGNDAHRPSDFELDQFGEHAMAGTPGAQVIPALAPQPADRVVPKRFYSAFTQTDLLATCRARGVDRLVIAGQHTDCCVRHTTYDAYRGGIPVTVAADTVAVYEPGADASVETRQRGALNYLTTYYGTTVLPTAAAVLSS